MRYVERYGLAFVRLYLGSFNLISGLNFFAGIWPQPVPQDAVGAAYMTATLHLGLFQMAKVVEILGGLSLTLGLCVPLGLVLLFPVTLTVFVMNVFFADLIHVRISGARNFAFHLLLLAAYGRYYFPLLTPDAPLRPIWRSGSEEPVSDTFAAVQNDRSH